MPIKGLTDRGVSFPQIGSIRKGGKKVQATDKATGKPRFDNGKPVMIQGPDLEYFRIEFDEREQDAAEKFRAIYGDKPTNILVVMPFDEIDRVWHAWREAYTAGALQHRCDGEYINYAINHDTGEIVVREWLNAQGDRVKCERQNLPNKAQRCKPTGRLHIIIPQLERLAYLVVHTTSIWDVANISENLAGIYEMNGKHIAGIPLVLRRKPVEIGTPSGENGKRARRVKWLIFVEADPEWVAAKLSAMRAASIPKSAQLAQIQAPISGPEWTEIDDDAEDEEIIGGAPDAGAPTVEQDHAPDEVMARVEARLTDMLAPVTPVKKCSIKTPLFASRLLPALAEKTKYYNDSKGMPQPYHVLGSAAKCGYSEITADNVESVLNDLIQHAIEQTLEMPSA